MDKHVDDFIEALRTKSSSIHTINNYEIDLKHFTEFLDLSKAALESIDHVFIRDFLNHLYTGRNLSKSSVSRKLACLKTFFKFMVREGRLKTNPAELISSPGCRKNFRPSWLKTRPRPMVELPRGIRSRRFATGPFSNCSMRADFG